MAVTLLANVELNLPGLEISQPLHQDVKIDCLVSGMSVFEGLEFHGDRVCTSGESKSHSFAKASLDCSGVRVL